MDSKQKLAAQYRGQLRSDEVECKVRAVMDIIKEEVSSNSGIYPHNGGLISKNEISRRAGIGMTTLFTKKQSKFRAEIDLWLVDLMSNSVDSPCGIRLSHAERAEAWKRKYEALSLSHHLSELDLQAARSDLERAETIIKKMVLENNNLRGELLGLRQPNVFPLRPN
jgi:hypothetical protein